MRWKNTDLDAGTMLIFGKCRSLDRTPIPSKCADALSALKQTQSPTTTDWPMFATGHTPSLFRTARDQLGPEYNHLLADVSGDTWELFRVHSLTPPALTAGGARHRMQQLTEQAGIEVEEGYLKSHAGRRGLGDLLYRIDSLRRR
jgi:integrase